MILREYIKSVIAEFVNMPKVEWVTVSLSDLSDRQIEALFAMYMVSYDADFGGIGLHPKIGAKEDLHRYKLTWLIDVDEDPDPDAFIMYRETPAGNKIVLLGSDGTRASKREVVSKTTGLMKTSGWYAEVSGKPRRIMMANNLPYIDNEETVRKILDSDTPIDWIGDGLYTRKIAGELAATKTIFGKPTGI